MSETETIRESVDETMAGGEEISTDYYFQTHLSCTTLPMEGWLFGW